jgi:hypothetical protein
MALSESRLIILPRTGHEFCLQSWEANAAYSADRVDVSSTSYRMPKTPHRQSAIELPRLLDGRPVVREE